MASNSKQKRKFESFLIFQVAHSLKQINSTIEIQHCKTLKFVQKPTPKNNALEVRTTLSSRVLHSGKSIRLEVFFYKAVMKYFTKHARPRPASFLRNQLRRKCFPVEQLHVSINSR